MVKCVYKKDKGNVCLTVNGHAGYAEYGQDIVCASVSILIETLIARLLQLNAKLIYKKESGAVFVEMEGVTYDANEAFEFAVLGLRMLEAAYPKNVNIKAE